uniref:Putative secreted protein n=1 Tax=Ixodes ricinus TaxID=34613 RepID=A0A6B0U090_IXORI
MSSRCQCQRWVVQMVLVVLVVPVVPVGLGYQESHRRRQYQRVPVVLLAPEVRQVLPVLVPLAGLWVPVVPAIPLLRPVRPIPAVHGLW